VNSGYGDEGTIASKLTDAVNKTADDEAVKAASQGSIWGLIEAGALEAAKYLVDGLVGLFTADCDGPLAADVYVFSENDLLHWNAGQINDLTRQYPGMDSAKGCGSKSLYTVNIRLQCVTNDPDILFFYRKDGSAATGHVRGAFTDTQWGQGTFGQWTHIVKAESGVLFFYNSENGSAATGHVAGDFADTQWPAGVFGK
jgi:hypothetical protein